jgi:hypothetical protein
MKPSAGMQAVAEVGGSSATAEALMDAAAGQEGAGGAHEERGNGSHSHRARWHGDGWEEHTPPLTRFIPGGIVLSKSTD